MKGLMAMRELDMEMEVEDLEFFGGEQHYVPNDFEMMKVKI